MFTDMNAYYSVPAITNRQQTVPASCASRDIATCFLLRRPGTFQDMDTTLRYLLSLVACISTVLAAPSKRASYWLRRSLFTVLLCVSSGVTYADFDAGVKAAKLRLYDEAFENLLPEAQAGNSTAQLYVANMYRRGYGIPRDMAMAMQWYQRAADQDEPSGMYNLGVHLRDGIGVSADQEAATQWFERAARKGHTSAMLNFGLRLFKGKGIARDRVRGYAWVQKAAGKGNIPAIRQRRSLEKDLGAEQAQRGRRMARNL
jgi:TPR repeat protein